MEKINEIVSKNIIKYRTISGLTQKELADKINYSDKSISKWERGIGLPDIVVLVELSTIFKVTPNDLLDPNVLNENIVYTPKKEKIHSHLIISSLSGITVWLVATIVFFVLHLIPETKDIAYYSFIYGIPIFGIVLTVFSAIWGNKYITCLTSSIILWGVLISIALSLKWIDGIWLITVIGAIVEVLLIVWFCFRKKKSA